MSTETKTTKEQAQEYVDRVGVDEARLSNHYITAKRHCKCGDCFCCFVFTVVNAAVTEDGGEKDTKMKTPKEMTTDELLRRMPDRPWNASGDVDPPKDEIEEFLLRAVNSFEALRETIDLVDAALANTYPVDPTKQRLAMRAHLKKALALSEGKESGVGK